jgi:hypothetical protein
MPKTVVLRASSIASLIVLSVIMATSKAAELKFLWQAEVQSEQANVYSEVSRDKPVVTVLNKGDFLNVILEISVLEDRWCRVAVPGQSEPTGYVLCKDLRMRRFDSTPSGETQPATHHRAAAPGNPVSAVATISNGSGARPGTLLNKDISDMSAAGLPSAVLIAKIKSSACEFDTSPATLKNLKASGIPNDVILAMIEAPSGQSKVLAREAFPERASPMTAPSTPTASPSDGKTRVLVTDSQSWESRGGSSAGGNRNGWGGSSWFAGGARPQTAEIIKTLNERCPQITVTNRLDKADFVLTLDHEGGKALLQRHNKIAVFNKDGDVIFSKSTISLGNSVKDACQVMSEARK